MIVVGDVSGKGAPAALYGAMASGTLRSLAPLKLPPPDMMKRLNVMFLERKIEGHFITLTYAVWEPRAKSLCLANAGMPLPILVRILLRGLSRHERRRAQGLRSHPH